MLFVVSFLSKWPQINKTRFTEIHEKESQLSVSVSMLSHPGNHRKFVRFTKINFSDFQWTRFSHVGFKQNPTGGSRLRLELNQTEDLGDKFTTTSLTLFNIQKSSSWRINLNVWQGWILSWCQHRSSRLIQIQTWASGIIMFFLESYLQNKACVAAEAKCFSLLTSVFSGDALKWRTWSWTTAARLRAVKLKKDLKGVQMTGLHNWHLLCTDWEWCVVPGTGWQLTAYHF